MNELTPEEIEKKYKNILLEIRARLRGDVSSMKESGLKKNRMDDDAANGSPMPQHMADVSSDNFEQEFTLSLAEAGTERLNEVNSALKRIEQGVYGICEICGQSIPKKRLDAIPYAKTCVDCASSKNKH